MTPSAYPPDMPLADLKISQSLHRAFENRTRDMRSVSDQAIAGSQTLAVLPVVRRALAAIFPSDKFILLSYARV
jgi:hypothetical protein